MQQSQILSIRAQIAIYYCDIFVYMCRKRPENKIDSKKIVGEKKFISLQIDFLYLLSHTNLFSSFYLFVTLSLYLFSFSTHIIFELEP